MKPPRDAQISMEREHDGTEPVEGCYGMLIDWYIDAAEDEQRKSYIEGIAREVEDWELVDCVSGAV